MKYYGKEKCKILKQIRAEIARQNDIEWVVSECRHKGDCRGTCPKCEQEVRRLEEALSRREALGKKVAVVGISAGIALSVTGCGVPFTTAGDPVEPSQQPGGAEISSETETYVAMGELLPESEEILDGVPVISESESDSGSLPVETLMGDPVMDESGDFGNIGEWDRVE